MLSLEPDEKTIALTTMVGAGINKDLAAGMNTIDALMQLVDNGDSGARTNMESQPGVDKGYVSVDLVEVNGVLTLQMDSTSGLHGKQAMIEAFTLKQLKEEKTAAPTGNTNNKAEGMKKLIAALGDPYENLTATMLMTSIWLKADRELDMHCSEYGSAVQVPGQKKGKSPNFAYIKPYYKQATAKKPARWMFSAADGDESSDDFEGRKAFIGALPELSPGVLAECDSPEEATTKKIELFNEMMGDVVPVVEEQVKQGCGRSMVRVIISSIGHRNDKPLFRKTDGKMEHLGDDDEYHCTATAVARKFTDDAKGVVIKVGGQEVHKLCMTNGGTDAKKGMPMAHMRLLKAAQKPTNLARSQSTTVSVEGKPMLRMTSFMDESVVARCTTQTLTKAFEKLASINTEQDLVKYEQDAHDKSAPLTGVVLVYGNRILNPNPGCLEVLNKTAFKCSATFSNSTTLLESEKQHLSGRAANTLLENRSNYLFGQQMQTNAEGKNVVPQAFADFGAASPGSSVGGLGLDGGMGVTQAEFAATNLLPSITDLGLKCCGRVSGPGVKIPKKCFNKPDTRKSDSWDVTETPAPSFKATVQNAGKPFEFVSSFFCGCKKAVGGENVDHKADAKPAWTDAEMSECKLLISDGQQTITHLQIAPPMVTVIEVLDLHSWSKTSDCNKERYGENSEMAKQQGCTGDMLMSTYRQLLLTTLYMHKPDELKVQLARRLQANSMAPAVKKAFAKCKAELYDEFVERHGDPHLKAEHEKEKKRAIVAEKAAAAANEALNIKMQEQRDRAAKNLGTREQLRSNTQEALEMTKFDAVKWAEDHAVPPRSRAQAFSASQLLVPEADDGYAANVYLWNDDYNDKVMLSEHDADRPVVLKTGRNPSQTNTNIASAETELLTVFHHNELLELDVPRGCMHYQARCMVPPSMRKAATREQLLGLLDAVCAATTGFVKRLNHGQYSKGRKSKTVDDLSGLSLNITTVKRMFKNHMEVNEYGESAVTAVTELDEVPDSEYDDNGNPLPHNEGRPAKRAKTSGSSDCSVVEEVENADEADDVEDEADDVEDEADDVEDEAPEHDDE